MPYAARKDVFLLALQLLAELRHLVAHFRLAARFGKRLRTAGNYHYLPRDLAVVAEPLRSIQRRTGELIAVNLLVAGSRRQFIRQPFNIVALGRALSNAGKERCFRGRYVRDDIREGFTDVIASGRQIVTIVGVSCLSHDCIP